MADSLGRGGSANVFKISRQGRKLQISDDPRTVLALPKDVAERTWMEVLQKEENEMICFEIREEIVDTALTIGYDHYMEKQTSLFTVHCAAVAILKIIDWHFYRHDPGEESNAYPPCHIPKRLESWIADTMPDPSVKDSWNLRRLRILWKPPEQVLPSCRASPRSIELPVEKPIPEEYWFPGRINLTTVYIGKDGVKKRHVMSEDYFLGLFDRVSELYSYDQYDDSEQTLDRYKDYSSEVLERITDYSPKDSIPASKVWFIFQDPNRIRPDVELIGGNGVWHFYEYASPSTSGTPTSKMEVTESEVLQKVTDYPGEAISISPQSKHSSVKNTTPVDGSLRGAGDSTVDHAEAKRRIRKSKSSLKGPTLSTKARLPPLMANSLSYVSKISDCRLRNLRLDAQYEIGSEKLEIPTLVKATTKKKL